MPQERAALEHYPDCAVHSPSLRPCSCGLETRFRNAISRAEDARDEARGAQYLLVAEVEGLKKKTQAALEFCSYAGVWQHKPLQRLRVVLEAERSKCRPGDNWNYWNYLIAKLAALSDSLSFASTAGEPSAAPAIHHGKYEGVIRAIVKIANYDGGADRARAFQDTKLVAAKAIAEFAILNIAVGGTTLHFNEMDEGDRSFVERSRELGGDYEKYLVAIIDRLCGRVRSLTAVARAEPQAFTAQSNPQETR